MPPAMRMWFSLTRIASYETDAVIDPAAAADGVLLDGPQPGRRLARVEDRDPGAGDLLDETAREGGDSGQAADEVERGALAGEDRPRRALELGQRRQAPRRRTSRPP